VSRGLTSHSTLYRSFPCAIVTRAAVLMFPLLEGLGPRESSTQHVFDVAVGLTLKAKRRAGHLASNNMADICVVLSGVKRRNGGTPHLLSSNPIDLVSRPRSVSK